MDKLIKLLKIIFLLVGICIGVAILAGIFFIYKGVKSGDLTGYVQKTAVETVLDEGNLSDEQKDMLESGNIEGLVEDLGQNITQEQIDCAVKAVGEKRARESLETQDPTPREMLLLSKCL